MIPFDDFPYDKWCTGLELYNKEYERFYKMGTVGAVTEESFFPKVKAIEIINLDGDSTGYNYTDLTHPGLYVGLVIEGFEI